VGPSGQSGRGLKAARYVQGNVEPKSLALPAAEHGEGVLQGGILLLSR
jgi:hypothetical protein